MSTDKWNWRFMMLAEHIATWSKERGRKVGAVIVGPDLEVRSTGFNGFPRGVNDDRNERHSREDGSKHLWSSHAERNAIYNAARIGTPLSGCSMYVPWYPCAECAKAIIQAGIARLFAYPPNYEDAKWGPEFRIVDQMLTEAGVQVEFLVRVDEGASIDRVSC